MYQDYEGNFCVAERTLTDNEFNVQVEILPLHETHGEKTRRMLVPLEEFYGIVQVSESKAVRRYTLKLKIDNTAT